MAVNSRMHSILAGCVLGSAVGVCFAQAPASAPSDSNSASPVCIVERFQDDQGVIVAKLSNGLRVVVRAVRTAPVVSVYGYVGAGGLYEGQWLGCGLSHLVEHLVAEYEVTDQGAGPGPAARAHTVGRAEDIGGQANAYTNYSHTSYFISAVAGKTNDCIDLIADQLTRPEISLQDFQREHGVVQRELEMGRDEPERVLYYAHMANFYRDHPAAVPVIGYAEPLARVTYDDALAYHRQRYVPQNMVFVVVGDIDPEAALRRVVDRMCGVASGREPSFELPEVSPLTGVRRSVCTHEAVREASEWLSFQTISAFDGDLYALDVLSTILEASRLINRLKFEKRLVTDVSTWSDTPTWGKGGFHAIFRAAPDRIDAAEQAVLAELREAAEKGVTKAELTRAKRQVVADYVRRQQTMDGIASTLGLDLLSTGDVAFSRTYTRNIQDVTAEQVRQAARKYFRFENMVITRMVPPPKARQTASAPAEPNHVPQTEVYTLPNGLKVVLHPTQDVGLTAMALAVKGGLLLETPKTNGLGSLMTALATRGAGGRSAKEISEFFGTAGGQVEAICGDNTFLYSASVLSDDFGKALAVFADVVLRPTLSAKELQAVRPLAESQIRRMDENWFTILQKFHRERFFTGSPWRMLPTGDLKVVQDATAEQIAAYHRRVLRAGSSVLAVYGDFDTSATKKLIERLFGVMPAGQVEMPLPGARKVAAQGEFYVLAAPTQQAGVLIAAPGTTVANVQDRLPLMLLDTILSGYRLPSGWLHNELRGKKLVYVVHASTKEGFAPGSFYAYAGTQPDKAPEVVRIIEANLRKAADYLPGREELDRAVNAIVTADILDQQTVDALAVSSALNELYGLGADWVRTLEAKLRAVTPEQVRQVAGKYLGGGYVVTVITPQPDVFPPETLVTEPAGAP